MLFLYELSHWAMGGLIVATTIFVVIGAFLLIRSRFRHEFSDAQVSAAMSFVGVMATLTSLLLAFSAVSVWDSFGSAEAAVVSEANVAAELARDLAVYGPTAVPARSAVRQYLNTVLNQEWSLLAKGEASLQAGLELDEVFRETGRIEPQTNRDSALIREIWSRVNGLAEARRNRLQASKARVPEMLWAVVLISTALTFLLTFVMPVTRFSVGLLTCLAATMGLVFFFIVAMDRPFAGRQSVDADPIRSTLTNMDRWDRTERDRLR